MAQGAPSALVRPARKEQSSARPAAVVAGGVALLLVVGCAINSSRGPSRTNLVEYVPMLGMPDPAEAVRAARVTVDQVNPFHTNGASAIAAAMAAGEDDIPKLITSPRYATTLGREAATHALSQPFNVPLKRGGHSVPSAAITPMGEYAPITPAYSNPLAQFIPNVTYYEIGNMGPGTRKGGKNIKFYNPYLVHDDDTDDDDDDDDSSKSIAAPTPSVDKALVQAAMAYEGSAAGGMLQAQSTESGPSYERALSNLYASLAEKEDKIKADERQAEAVKDALDRITRAAQGQRQIRDLTTVGGFMPVYNSEGSNGFQQAPASGRMITISPTGPQQ